MTQTLKEAKLSSRADRKRLQSRAAPYWRGIDREVHLGYRKGKRGGQWLVRWRAGDGYKQVGLGTADDELREGTLDFEAAINAARGCVEAQRREVRAVEGGSRLTVGSVLATYISARDDRDSARRGRPVRSDASHRLCRYVIGRHATGSRRAVEASFLASIALHELAEDDLTAWRDQLPPILKWTTKRRLTNDLKAALNDAYASNRSRLPATLPGTIKYGLREISQAQDGEADDADLDVARECQILTDNQVSRILCAAREIDSEQGWDGDLFRVLVVLAATGSRFSQIIRLRVRDVQIDGLRLMVPSSRKGRGGKKANTGVAVGTDVITALRPALDGRLATATLLERWRNKQLPGSVQWHRVDRGPWQTASEITRAWHTVRERAGLPEAIPYSLRHSSIVRGIRANLPTRLVAALHDTSVQMIERHYARYIADGLDELAARAVVPLVTHADARGEHEIADFVRGVKSR